jgi:S1-C subfamily serine protease
MRRHGSLTVLDGSRAGCRVPLADSPATLGRHPAADVAFDPAGDLDVSTWHATVFRRGDGWFVRDLGSTNGTWVNGRRLRGDQALRPGDTIRLGTRGPEVRFALAAEDGPGPSTTGVRIRAEVARQISPLRRRVAALSAVAVLAVLGLVGALVLRPAEPGRAVAMDRGRPPDSGDGLQAALAAVAATHRDAVVMVFVDRADGSAVTSTGFVARTRGDTAWIVTSRHALLDAAGRAPGRVAVVVHGGRDLHGARYAGSHPAADLGLLRVLLPRATALRPGPAPAAVGDAVVTMGFPLGLDLPMGGDWREVGLTASVLLGTVSRLAPGLLQLDGYGASGASGSPVLNARGELVGVLYGEERGSGGRILYAVPAGEILELLR